MDKQSFATLLSAPKLFLRENACVHLFSYETTEAMDSHRIRIPQRFGVVEEEG